MEEDWRIVQVSFLGKEDRKGGGRGVSILYIVFFTRAGLGVKVCSMFGSV